MDHFLTGSFQWVQWFIAMMANNENDIVQVKRFGQSQTLKREN